MRHEIEAGARRPSTSGTVANAPWRSSRRYDGCAVAQEDLAASHQRIALRSGISDFVNLPGVERLRLHLHFRFFHSPRVCDLPRLHLHDRNHNRILASRTFENCCFPCLLDGSPGSRDMRRPEPCSSTCFQGCPPRHPAPPRWLSLDSADSPGTAPTARAAKTFSQGGPIPRTYEKLKRLRVSLPPLRPPRTPAAREPQGSPRGRAGND